MDLVVPTGLDLRADRAERRRQVDDVLDDRHAAARRRAARCRSSASTRRADARDVRRRLGYMPDVLGVYDNLRVDEYLEFFAASYQHPPPPSGPSLVDGLLELVDLASKRAAMVNSLSRGMKQRLSLARTLVHDPELLVLDEPASGLDPRARVELRELLRQLNEMGKTIIISSHILAELEEMCTDVAIMEAGRLLAVRPAAARSSSTLGARAPGARCASPTARPRRSPSPTTTSRPRCCGVSSSTSGATVVEFVEEHARPRAAVPVDHRGDRAVSDA